MYAEAKIIKMLESGAEVIRSSERNHFSIQSPYSSEDKEEHPEDGLFLEVHHNSSPACTDIKAILSLYEGGEKTGEIFGTFYKTYGMSNNVHKENEDWQVIEKYNLLA